MGELLRYSSRNWDGFPKVSFLSLLPFFVLVSPPHETKQNETKKNSADHRDGDRSGFKLVTGELYVLISFLFILYSFCNFRLRATRINNHQVFFFFFSFFPLPILVLILFLSLL